METIGFVVVAVMCIVILGTIGITLARGLVTPHKRKEDTNVYPEDRSQNSNDKKGG